MMIERNHRRNVVAVATVVSALWVLGSAAVCFARAGDLSEPKAAAKTFLTAMINHDLATMKSASVGTEEDWNRAETLADVVAAQKKFVEAAKSKYGDDAKVPRGDMTADLQQRLDSTEVKIEGDEASLADPKQPQANPIKLKKESGEWKMELSSMRPRAAGGAAAGGAGEPEQLRKMTGVLNQMGDEIAAGKYPTFGEAQTAMQQKMMAALAPGVGANPRGGPASQPASQPGR